MNTIGDHPSWYSCRALAMRPVKGQIQKALRDVLTTGLEYVEGQLVGVRERKDSAKGFSGRVSL